MAGTGTCRVCGCTEDRACLVEVDGLGQAIACAWADHTRTLCDNPACVKAAAAEAAERHQAAR